MGKSIDPPEDLSGPKMAERLRAFAVMAEEGHFSRRDLIEALGAWDPMTKALRAVYDLPWGWGLSAIHIHGSHKTYGFYCLLDRGKPGTGGHGGPGDMEIAVGCGQHIVDAILDAVEKAKAISVADERAAREAKALSGGEA